ncbi:MAG TPA: threonine--tRNA ligase [Candidatus Pygmaiobacter gallistercoris]|nr:threonine--tRNA ligase [Candidatus Pygmaiobacter gallistercoris]
MIKVSLKDGLVKEFEAGTSAAEVAKSLGMGLYKAATCAKVDGEVVDLRTPLEKDCKLEILTFADKEGKQAFWHTGAHVMAQAIQHLFPGAHFGIGPALEHGWYYDIGGIAPITPDQFEAIEEEMHRIVKADLPVERRFITVEEGREIFAGQSYKLELLEEYAAKGWQLSVYQQGDFTDLCAGPHLMSTGALKAVKLLSTASAYWRGDAANDSLCRIYGIAFPKKDELAAYLEQIEEAKRRDHRKLGRELGLFAFRDEAPGFPFYLPKGMILKNALIDYWREVHRKWDYVEISTPQIMRRTLWETSGHWDHYKENMYTTVIDGEDFAIKPMNCPGSILVYELEKHSYRDLPLRYGELGIVHRHELSGALHGMFRVRCFTQDDAHILLTKEQITDEVVRIARLFDEVYSLFGLPYTIELSTMPEDHLGSVEDWDIATNALADAIKSIGKEYEINEGDGAFYGPKLDFHIQDSIGRTWQCGTIQLDYQLPGRFNLEYTGADGEAHCPVMIHRVVFGSIERFIGILTEHYAGAFPTWLSPVQVEVIPIGESHHAYAQKVTDALKAAGLRAECDLRSEKMNYKIREAQLQKIPYMLVVGDKEAADGTVSVRARKDKESAAGVKKLDEFIAEVTAEVAARVSR